MDEQPEKKETLLEKIIGEMVHDVYSTMWGKAHEENRDSAAAITVFFCGDRFSTAALSEKEKIMQLLKRDKVIFSCRMNGCVVMAHHANGMESADTAERDYLCLEDKESMI